MTCSFRRHDNSKTQPNCERDKRQENERGVLVIYFPLHHKLWTPHALVSHLTVIYCIIDTKAIALFIFSHYNAF